MVSIVVTLSFKRISSRPVLCVPEPLQVLDQRRAEMTLGLLAGIDRAIAAEHVERLLRDPERAPIADRADGAGAGEPGDDALDRLVHLIGLCDLIADQAPLEAVADKLALILDRLAGDAVAGEARQAQIGGARHDPLLARRQRQVGVLRGEDEIHGEQDLTVAADSKALDRGDPGFLDAAASDVIAQHVGARNPAQELVREAKLALEEQDEWKLAAIEMREIDAAAEDATSRVFGVVHRPPAQHCDVTLRIEDCHIDTNLHSADRGLVLGIQEARVGHDEMDGAAVALEANRAEIKRTASLASASWDSGRGSSIAWQRCRPD